MLNRPTFGGHIKWGALFSYTSKFWTRFGQLKKQAGLLLLQLAVIPYKSVAAR